MMGLSNYPTSLHCCCCTIHLVFQSTTDKHCKLKEVLQMRISHYNDSVPLWEEFTENTAELSSWLDDIEAQFASERCQSGDAIQTANALDIVRALLDDTAAKRDNFQQLRPLAGWACACVVYDVSVCLCACVCVCECACERACVKSQ